MRAVPFIAAALLIAIASWWFLAYDRPDIPERPTTPPVDTETAAPITPAAAPPPPPPQTEPEQNAIRLRGYIQSLDSGKGIEGVTVRVSWNDGEPREARLTSRAEGAFMLDNVRAGKYSVRAWHESYATEKSRYSVELVKDESPSDLVIWMTDGGAIAGRVVDAATKAGIAGVKVGLDRSQTRGIVTDADGRYRIPGVRTGNRRVFVGHARGYIDAPEYEDGVRVEVRGGQDVGEVDFKLQRGVFAAISGTVVDAGEAPVPGAEVWATQLDSLTRDGQGKKDKTDAEGRFFLDEFKVADGFYVSATAAELVSEEVGPLGLTADGISDLVLTLRPTASISGQAVDEATDEPIPETEWVVDALYTSRGRNMGGGLSTHLDGSGNFKLTDLRPGTYGLFIDTDPNVWRSGIIRAQIEVTVEHGQHVEDVVLTYDYARYLEAKSRPSPSQPPAEQPPKPTVGEVRGRVINARTNEPVTSFELKTMHSHMGMRQSSQTVHDPEGRFTIGEEEGETLRIDVLAKEFAAAETVVAGGMGDQPAHDVVIRLEPGAVVEGVVLDASRAMVAGAQIYVGHDPTEHHSAAMGMTPDAVSGPDGTFRLATLTPAKTRVYAKHPSFASGFADVTASISRTTRLEIVLGEGGAIEGFIRCDGQAIRGHHVMVLNAEGNNIELTGNVTDSEGRYRLNHLPPGMYTLYTSVDNHNHSLNIEAAVAEGKSTRVDFNFEQTGNTVVGAVTLDGHEPFTINANIQAETPAGVVGIRGFFPRTNQFVLNNVPEGDVTLTVQARLEDQSKGSETIVFPVTGGEIRRDFQLTSKP